MSTPKALSKSRLMNYRQCAKRLWLEVHQPELRQDSAGTQASFATGHQVGAIAQKLYDPKGKGTVIDAQAEGFAAAFERTQGLLQNSNAPVFEAGFSATGGLAFADVMLPAKKAGERVWRMVEVKSSSQVKDYHRDDAAIQAFVARESGVPLVKIALAHINSEFVYPGNEDYNGLLVEEDLTKEAFARGDEVRGWIAEAQRIVALPVAPEMATGSHCDDPYECGFYAHCRSKEPQAEQPIQWLPNVRTDDLRAFIAEHPNAEISEAPDGLLNRQQQRVKAVTLSRQTFFDREGAKKALAGHALPAYFLDFETIGFTVPIWKGTRPFQQIPFQFSLHRLSRTGKLESQAFLNLDGADPSKAFAERLLDACGDRGPIFVYNAGFETARIRELAERFPRMKKALLALNERVVDLLPVARDHYYHPSQEGSWSIKAVLPALCPELNYEQLDGVQNGGDAQAAYLKAIHPDTPMEHKQQLERQLLKYCEMDTYAMVRLWAAFTGYALKKENHG
jgi:hypothetical protein